jgi:Putative beta barrel porin-7 (BBP7)
MRSAVAGCLILLVPLLTGKAYADDGPFIPNGSAAVKDNGENPVTVTIGRPVAIAPSPSTPTVAKPILDRQLVPASFNVPPIDGSLSVLSGQIEDLPQPMPLSPDGRKSQIAPVPDTKSDGASKKQNLLRPVPDGALPSGSGGDPCVCDEGNCSTSCDGPACCWGFCWERLANLPLFRGGCFEQPPYCMWFDAEYLYLWTKGDNLPPLVTTSPAGTVRSQAGVLGAPGTTVLLGGANAFDSNGTSGGRFTLGTWFNPQNTIGLQGTFFFLGERNNTFEAASNGLPILARPFFNVNTGMEDSELVAYPGVVAGRIGVTSTMDLRGADIDMRLNWFKGCCWKLDVLAGFRYVNLEETLSVNEFLNVPSGASIAVADGFGTHNNFYGGDIGLDLELRRGRWTLDMLGKVALGGITSTGHISGSTAFFVPGQPVTAFPGGLLALPSNIGSYSKDQFAVSPEVDLRLKYQITPRIQAFLGYSFLYLDNVARPSGLINRAVNVTQLPSQIGPGALVGAANPVGGIRTTDFWAQGITVGLEIRW